MVDIEWRDGDLPVSTRFDDPYYSRENGRAETAYVFVEGNDLPSRWPDLKTCTIAELGFGTGLNFLETVHQWRNAVGQGARLDYISFEQFPISVDNMTKALSVWPELQSLANRLCEIWTRDQDKLTVEFLPDISITIHFGDANELLPNLRFEADAWYLDGFSPAKNPELWNKELLQEVADHTVAGGTFATYTAAGHVRRSLQSAGFEVIRQKGFGSKREMLTGRLSNDIRVADGH